MSTGTSNNMETSIYSIGIEFESIEMEIVSGAPGIKSIPQSPDQTATTSVLDAICFPPFESQSNIVTGN